MKRWQIAEILYGFKYGSLSFADAVDELALAAGSRRAKTAKPVECEASQSGPQGNAQKQSQNQSPNQRG